MKKINNLQKMLAFFVTDKYNIICLRGVAQFG